MREAILKVFRGTPVEAGKFITYKVPVEEGMVVRLRFQE